MVEVNEEIARAYFEEVCGYMVRTGFYFKKVREKRAGKTKGGAGPADIDLLILQPFQAETTMREWTSASSKITAC